jgi:hypothetical protein
MTAVELEKLSPNERQLCLSFGSADPRIVRLPHCVVRHGVDAVAAILETVGARPGIWGEEPLVDAKGEPFLAPDDGRLVQEFRLWALPANQAEVRRYAEERRNTSKFTMLIAAEAAVEVLAKAYDEIGACDLSDYYHYIDRLADWIDELEWAYVPLEYDAQFALFVAASNRQDIVRRVEHAFSQRDQLAFRIAQSDAGWDWSGPFQ